MKKEKKIRIMFVDDHQILIDGMKALLKNNIQFEIAGEATRCEKALEIIPRINPDIIVTDINMPEMSGIEFTAVINKKYPQIKILALSMYGEKGMISEMLDAGVSGYILKNTGKQELVDALLKIHDGGLFFSDEVSAEMMKNIAEKKQLSTEEQKAHLTPREKEIIQLIAKEFSNSQIAEALFISERTVETHRKNIFRKTNTKSLVGLIKYAIENNLTN
ncbi:MAG: response regulator transcription factor [Bacteroidetes bacterium]|nr:response regulator transcription factor [Bacteroidota bacterium]